MKKFLSACIIVLSFSGHSTANAENLVQVYQQALTSDPVYQQAIAQKLVDQEGVPISLAALLPSASLAASPTLDKIDASGSATFPGTSTQRGYTIGLTLTQTIFNFGQFAALAGAKEISKQADAILIAATQELIVRIATAYFDILQSEDNLRYISATRTAFAKQLDQVKQQYQVGLKTITDVYTAQASYESSVADYIGAENQLANSKENLRAITGILYTSLAKLSEDFPLISPQPANVEEWVTTAGKQNWSIKAKQYAANAAHQNIRQQFAGHLPSLTVQGAYGIDFTRNIGGTSFTDVGGASQLHTSSVSLNLTVPLVQGGLVTAQTRQAQYSYQVAGQQLETQLRQTLNQTRQSFLGVTAGISKIAADKQAIKSAISSLEGMEAGYRVGTEILVNVLDQQQKVFLAQRQYANDRYAYVRDLLALKQAAGTLSQEDLVAINSWLYYERVKGKDKLTKKTV